MSDETIEIAGERLRLLPERAIFWERTRTLLVADPHFGKAATFRALGVPVPRGTTTGSLARLDQAIARVQPRRIVFLGDFLHAAEGRAAETLRVIKEWREVHAATEMVLVRGNHDIKAGDPPANLGITCVDPEVAERPYVFAHEPGPSAHGYVLCGHLHPGVRLSGVGREHARLPCFWFGSEVGVLPAFGEFTGLARVPVQSGDRILVVTEEAVIRVGTD